jgi:hypothetical protein
VDCEQARDLVERQPDEPLSGVEAAELHAHLAACAACSRLAEETTALLQQLRELRFVDGDDPAWRACVRRAVPEGASRLRAHCDRRAIRRLAWATAAVWAVTWLLGSLVGPRASRAGPPPAGLAIAEVGAPDVDAIADEPYGGFHARLDAAVRVRPTHDAPAVIRRGIVIERLLGGEDLPDEPDADQALRAPGPKSPDRRPRVEDRGHV